MSYLENFTQDFTSQDKSTLSLLDKLSQTSIQKLVNFDASKKNDDWKYTNPAKLLDHPFKLDNPSHHSKLNHIEEDEFHHIVLSHPLNLQHAEFEKYGIIITPLAEVEKEKLGEIFSNDTYYQDDVLSLLNNSFFANAYAIEIAENTICEKPILIDHWFHGENVHHCYQGVIIANKNSDFTVIENIKTSGESGLINFKSYALLSLGTKISHTIVQDAHTKDNVALQINSRGHKNSHYNNTIINLGGNISRNNLFINLIDQGATADVNGLYLLENGQHHDTMSFIRHAHAHTYSNQLYKGILNGKSRGIFTGKVRVEKNAQQIDAKQLNKNLILDPKAQANSRPQMEIYADDVKCAHGSTTGQLSEEELFYFTARGIKPETARKMLAHGYSNDVILKINNRQAQKFVTDKIQQRESHI